MSHHQAYPVKQLLLVILGYSILAIVVTWPVAAKVATVVGGFDGRDSFQHVWLYWWFWEALLSDKQLPSTVTGIYFPLGAAHPVLWLHALTNLFGFPLYSIVGPIVTYNLTILLSIVLTALTAFLLTKAITAQTDAAFIGGLVFAFAPIRLGHTVAGHQLLVFAFALPLYTLALCLWLKQPGRQRTILYTISLILVVLTHPNFIGYFLPLITAVLIIDYWLRSKNFSQKHRQQLFISWGVAAIACLPFIWPTLVELAQQNLQYLQPKNTGEHSADLLSFITPSPYHPIWQENPPEILTRVLNRPRALEEGFNYLGLVAITLSLIAIWFQWSKTRTWLTLGLIAAILSLGPTLIVSGNLVDVPLPYRLLSNLSFFSWSRTPARLNITTMLAVSIIVAIGLAYLLPKIQRSAPRWGLTFALAIIIIFEYIPLWPFPVDYQPVPAYYQQLAQTHLNGAVLEIPVTGSRRAGNYAMYYQTVHGQPLAGGYIERNPPGTLELKEFLNQLVSPVPPQQALAEPQAAERLAILADMQISRIIVHPKFMTDSAARATAAYLPTLFPQALPNNDNDTLQVFHVPDQINQPLPAQILLPDQENWEAIDNGEALRLKKNGYLFVYTATPGKLILEFETTPQNSLTELTLWVNDQIIQNFAVNGTTELKTEALLLNKGLNYMRLTTTPPQDINFSKIVMNLNGSN